VFELKVKLTTRLMLRLAYKYFAVKLGITDDQLAMMDIEIVKRLGGTGGTCSGSYNLKDELVKVSIKIQDFASDVGLIDVLAHEMVHAKQHFNGEFSFSERKITFLKFFTLTEKIQIHKGQILRDTPYFERLCEQEAFSRSRELTTQFLNFFSQLEQADASIIKH
jgi:hypothetical protein